MYLQLYINYAGKFFLYVVFYFLTFTYFTFYGMMAVGLTPTQHLAAVVSSAFYSLWNLLSGFLIPKPVSNPLPDSIMYMWSHAPIPCVCTHFKSIYASMTMHTCCSPVQTLNTIIYHCHKFIIAKPVRNLKFWEFFCHSSPKAH